MEYPHNYTPHWLPLHSLHTVGELKLNGPNIPYIFLFHFLVFRGVLLYDALEN